MTSNLRPVLTATLLVACVSVVPAQRGHNDRPAAPQQQAPVQQAPVQRAPAPAPVQVAPAPAPIQRSELPPTRVFNPPSAAPIAPVRQESPRYTPPVRQEAPRYSAPVRQETPRYAPPVPSEAPRSSAPVQRDSGSYAPPVVRDDWSRRVSGSERISTPPSSGAPADRSPVRVVYPGTSDVHAGADREPAPPAIGAPVRARINTGWRETGSERAADRSPTLRDLYRRPDRTADGDVRAPRPGSVDERAKIAPALNDTLSGRYRERLDRDLARGGASDARRRGGAGDSPAAGADRRAVAPDKASTAVANHRYPVAGREVGNVKVSAAPTPSPVLGDAARTKSVALEPIRTKPPTVGSGGGSKLSPVPLTPTLRSRASGQWHDPYRYHSGASHWSGHCAALGFGFGNCGASAYWRWGSGWGCYSYPYYWSCWWPRYWWSSSWGCSSWYGWSWPNYASCYWWPAPATCYAPIVWNTYDYGSWYEDEHREPTVIYEVIHESVPEEEHVGVPAKPPDDSSPLRLAERHVGMGDYYFREGRFQEAVEAYLRALGYVPDDATLHFVLADALFATGDYHYAAFIIGKALKLDPGLARSTADKRTFYKDPKRFDEQMGILRGYVKDKPYDAAGWLVLGYNLKFSEEASEAKKAFERVLEIDPGNEPAKVFLAALSEAPASRPASR